jgi:hypothetical protein
MNIYFLVEGEKTEEKVYPLWIAYLIPKLTRVDRFYKVQNNNYYLHNSGGQPSIYTHIENATKDINYTEKYDYFVICLDADELSVEERINEINDLIGRKNIKLKAELVVIVQNRCIETWFLGNRKVYTRNPQNHPFVEYTQFYNVCENDPELLGKYQGFNTVSQFHIKYLKEMFKEKNISYSKTNPIIICLKLQI